MKTRTITKVVMTSTGVAAGALAAAGVLFTNKIMHIKKRSDDLIVEFETQKHHSFTLSEFEARPKEAFELDSPHGYRIHGYYIPAEPESPKKFMIFCHGVTVNLLTSIKYAKLFLKRGFNVILFDERRHGQTGGKSTSYGYYEKDDLATVVHWVKNRFGTDIVLGIHGESMGAATLLQYAGLVEDGADFYIADCPFSDFTEQLHYLMKRDYHLPKWLIFPVTKLFLRIRDGYNLDQVSPLLGIRNINHPILFIHSKNDDYIPVKMTQDLYEAKLGNKQLFIAENGGHACSLRENREAYEKALDRFLSEYVPESAKPAAT